MKTTKLVLNTLGLVLGCSIAGATHGAAPFDPDKQPYGQLPPLSVTGFNLSSGTERVFQNWFDGNNWAGDVVAYPISASGQTNTVSRLWSASDVFRANQACGNGSPTDPATSTTDWWNLKRKVVTLTPAKSRKAFRWPTITGTGTVEVLNYIRGDRSNEIQNVVKDGTGTVIQYECGSATGTLRPRTSLLGDILHGNSVYIAGPPADYKFENYQAYKTLYAARAPRLYVGANDGMVHAFDTANGEEIFAYIPSMLIPKLSKLSVEPYAHTYFVDGGLTAGDVYDPIPKEWKTVLIGGLGAGGKGLYALNVTSPDAANDTAAAAKILWEKTPTELPDLGDTYGEPIIARLNDTNGTWAAIVGNGYNNTGNGKAVLYVINIITGAVIASLEVGSSAAGSPNGLSSPKAIDINFDARDDIVYAGDIDGNLWKFDISDPNPSNWTSPASPLYSTSAGQAIIGAPDVVAHPISGYLIYFASGRLFDAADAVDNVVENHAYGIWDGAPVANNTILDQTLANKTFGVLRVRVTSGLPINWSDATDVSTKPLHYGWRMALPKGERVLGTGFVRDARYHFSSVNPTITNTPPPNGENWLNELEYLTGAVGAKPIYDLNSDSLLTDADRVLDGSSKPVAGPTGIPVSIYQGGGLLSQPLLAILSATLSTTLFNDNPFFDPDDVPAFPPVVGDPGVSGGHFDVDVYDWEKSKKHKHEYDDIYDVTGVNMLAPSLPDLAISTRISNKNRKFKILIANQKMSPAVEFTYGGLPYKNVTKMAAYTTTGLDVTTLPSFARIDVNTLAFKMPKDAFKVKDWSGTSDPRVGLMPTQTGCVNRGTTGTGDIGPSPEQLHKNGALTFQLVKDTIGVGDVEMADNSNNPENGYRVKLGSRKNMLLAEWTVFWHHTPSKLCWNDAGWIPNPVEDLAPSDPKKALTPAAGSSDPPRDGYGGVISTTSVITTNPEDSLGTLNTTTFVFANGIKLIVEEYRDKDNKVTKTIFTTISPPLPGGGGLPGNGVSQALAAGNTVTGYQQTRNSGKLGRISWHELFAP